LNNYLITNKQKTEKVWDQRGFEAKFKTEEKFNRACEVDPTVGHKFQEMLFMKTVWFHY
jgi:hypothetical protein